MLFYTIVLPFFHKMKIAFVKDAVYPWEMGGAQKRVWEIAHRLAEDHEVHIFGMHYWEGPKTIERDDVILHGVCQPIDLYSGDKRSIYQAVAFATYVAKDLQGHDFDIVDCQKSSYFPFFASKAHELTRGSVLVGTFNEAWDEYWYEYLGRVGFVGKMIERTTLSLPERIITISDRNKRKLAAMGRNIDEIQVVPDGISFDEIKAIQPADTGYDVVYAGRLISHKNVDLLLRAIEEVNAQNDLTISCAVIGDGPEKENLQQSASELEVDAAVDFLGFLEDHDDVYAYMKSSRVFILPSSREGAGLVTLEANACGTPAITTAHRNNAATEVVEDGVNGFVCDLDVAEIGETILKARQQADQMEKDCIDYAKEYDWSEIARHTEMVYGDVKEERFS